MSPSGRRILLVDDEPAIIKVIGKRLETRGFEVFTAIDGEEALTKAKLSKPNAIILDLMLPKRSGFEVCATLKKDPTTRHIPIIIFTGKGQVMDERLCRELGADAYINKAQQSHVLVEQLEALLGQVLTDTSSTSRGLESTP